MQPILEILGVALVFLMRLGIPILLTFGVAYWLRRLDDKWQAEAAALELGLAPETVAAATAPPALAATQPCWEVRNCNPATREQCPAFHQSKLPCWMARQQAEGKMPTPCLTCALFRSGLATSPQAVPSRPRT